MINLTVKVTSNILELYEETSRLITMEYSKEQTEDCLNIPQCFKLFPDYMSLASKLNISYINPELEERITENIKKCANESVLSKFKKDLAFKVKTHTKEETPVH